MNFVQSLVYLLVPIALGALNLSQVIRWRTKYSGRFLSGVLSILEVFVFFGSAVWMFITLWKGGWPIFFRISTWFFISATLAELLDLAKNKKPDFWDYICFLLSLVPTYYSVSVLTSNCVAP